MKQVIVVGAGLAGLAAAYELSKDDRLHVTVLEARDRIGGRVYSNTLNGHSVDFGGFIVYPWYWEYHRLVDELGLRDELVRLPLRDIYYELSPGVFTPQRAIRFPFRDVIRLAWHIIPKLFHRKNSVGYPKLDLFKGRTIAEHLRHMLGYSGEQKYERYMDIISQGYCYGPLEEYKMAFVAPIYRNLVLHGNLFKSEHFSGDALALPRALQEAIERNGGEVRLGEPVTDVEDGRVVTPEATYGADRVVFAQPAHADLYSQILPDAPADCWYTHFYGVMLRVDRPYLIDGHTSWGAIFYDQHEERTYDILSAVNLPALHGDVHKSYLNINVLARVPASDGAISKDELFAELQPALARQFPGLQVHEIVQMEHWPEAMPVAQESFVKAVRAAQGRNGYYFAGDFLGGPSMEAALETGVAAARRLRSDLG